MGCCREKVGWGKVGVGKKWVVVGEKWVVGCRGKVGCWVQGKSGLL